MFQISKKNNNQESITVDLQKQEGKLEHQEMMLKEIIVENKNLR
jgi:hypothetical protein